MTDIELIMMIDHDHDTVACVADTCVRKCKTTQASALQTNDNGDEEQF